STFPICHRFSLHNSPPLATIAPAMSPWRLPRYLPAALSWEVPMTHPTLSRSAGLLALFLLASTAAAVAPDDPAKRAAIVGTPASLAVEPGTLTLSGPRSMQQLVVTGKYADGSVRDLTPFCSYTIDQPVLAIDQTGFVVAAKDGTA